jgi:hypothetical protein
MNMSRIVKILIAANLIVLTVLVFVYPNLMVGPGKLIPGHNSLETDCFACHAAFTGADSSRCVVCHKSADIGRLTTTGQPIVKPLTSVPFHQRLITLECITCHSDHAGVKRFRPQGHFDHQMLQAEMRNQCQTCHQPPRDPLHSQITANCNQCHNQEKWVPASFDHNKYFVLDGNHNSRCATCHTSNDYSRYTCYGCHEHTPEDIRRKHVEENIRNYTNCVECHRSAGEHEGGGERGKSEGKRGGKKHDSD